MSDLNPVRPADPQGAQPVLPGQEHPSSVPATPSSSPLPPQAYAAHAPRTSTGPVGQVRSTGTCILLFIITLGIYGWIYYYKTHEEMKQHSGEGLGGAVALILGMFVSLVMVFLHPAAVGSLRERAGQEKRVTGMTGLWMLLPIAGAFVWFIKTNGALNDYWTSQGAAA